MPASSGQAAATYDDVFKDVVIRAGLCDPTDPTGATVNTNAPYTSDIIKRWICQADNALIIEIMKSPGHWFKWALNWSEVSVSDLDAMPGYPAYSDVRMDDGQTTNIARQAQSLDHLMRWRDRTLANPGYMYFIHDGRVYTAPVSQSITFRFPDVTFANPGDSPPVLLCPLAYHNALVGYTLMLMWLPGTDSEHRKAWIEIGNMIISEVRNNVSFIAPIERSARISY